jgi:S-adenosylmethionine-diacylglycerol 3-amino-3-carboxypropyl transferase
MAGRALWSACPRLEVTMASTDVASRARFDRIRYAQVWEDADILSEAMDLKPGETAISIASAGDNALALLADGCDRVIAVDLNPAQLACVRLRICAYRTLHHDELLELIGSRPSSRRGELLDTVAKTLNPDDQAFWARRKGEVCRHGAGGVGKFESYFRIFRRIALPLVQEQDTIDDLLRPRPAEQRSDFFETRWNNKAWRWMLSVFFSRTLMGRLGRDPAFFDHVEGNPADQVARLTRRALIDQDPSENPYLHWILKGRHGAALPRALRPEAFDVIRNRLDRLELRLCTVEQLAEEGIKADAFNLSDIFEYMSPPAHEAAYRSILAAARPGARIVYWNMMAPRRVPQALAPSVRRLDALEQTLKPRDRAFFYNDFVVEEVV